MVESHFVPGQIKPDRDLQRGTLVVTLPGAWRNWVSVRNGWPGVSTLGMDETAGWSCALNLSVAAARKPSKQTRP